MGYVRPLPMETPGLRAGRNPQASRLPAGMRNAAQRESHSFVPRVLHPEPGLSQAASRPQHLCLPAALPQHRLCHRLLRALMLLTVVPPVTDSFPKGWIQP